MCVCVCSHPGRREETAPLANHSSISSLQHTQNGISVLLLLAVGYLISCFTLGNPISTVNSRAQLQKDELTGILDL